MKVQESKIRKIEAILQEKGYEVEVSGIGSPVASIYATKDSGSLLFQSIHVMVGPKGGFLGGSRSSITSTRGLESWNQALAWAKV